MTTARLTAFGFAIAISVLFAGCNGDSSSGVGSFTRSLSGNWVGAWENNGLGPGSQNQGTTDKGLMQTHLQQGSNGNISGTATWTGFSCFQTASVTGIVAGSGVSLTFASGSMRVTFNGQRVTDNSIEGSWDNDAGCTGQGSLTINRQSG